MKNQISWIRNAGMLLLISPLAIGCLQSVTEPVEQATSVAPTTTETDSVTEATFADSTSATDTDMDEDWSGDEFGFSAFPMENLSDVPVTFVTDELFVPANIHPGPGTIEVIKLADSGVEESVILAYIINSSERFNLGPDEIIYLNDIGIPSALITAMLQRDHILQAIAMAPQPIQEQVPIPLESPIAPPEVAFSQPPPVPMPDTTVAMDDSSEEPEPMPEVPPTTAPLFYDALAPYGSWVDIGGSYGRCWRPTIAARYANWQPYCDGGRWIYTDCGWYWKSDYSWGWAAFHYGRWFRHPTMGWCWCPDDVWGPSWVCWRSAADYCGWAPLPPGAGFTPAGELCFHGRPCTAHFHFRLGWHSFRFVSTHHFCDPHVSRHTLPSDRVPHFYHQTTVSNPNLANHRVVNDGIGREQIATAVRHEIPRVVLHDSQNLSSRGTRDRFESNGRMLAVYRPFNMSRSFAHMETAGRPVLPSGHGSAGAENQNHSPTAQFASLTTSRPLAALPGVIGAERPSNSYSRDIAGGRPSNNANNSASASASGGSLSASRASFQSQPKPRPAMSPQSPYSITRPAGVNSLAIIGHRGGHDSTANRHPIQVFSTPASSGGRELPTNQGQGQNQATLPWWMNRSASTHPWANSAESIASSSRNESQPPESVPWWLTRATPNQPAANSAEPSSGYHHQQQQQQQHFQPYHVSHNEGRPHSQEEAVPHPRQDPPPSAPAPQPQQTTHSEVHSASAAAAPASHSSSSTQSSSGSGRR